MIYIKDIDDAVSSKILKFADDTKITASISSVEERNILQTDLTRLMEWSEAWQMKSFDAISTHLESNSRIKSSQHGFSSGKSCLTILLIYLEQVTSEIDKGIPVDTIYLDFAKAFDKVPHHRLIEKIAANGIGRKISK